MLTRFKQRPDVALVRAKFRLRQLAADALDDPPQPIIVKDRNRVYVIPVETLDYVEAQADYVAFHSGGRSYLKLQSISSLETELDSARFVRVHRSSIVNLERIARIVRCAKDSAVTLADGTRLAMSRAGYARLLAAMDHSPDRSVREPAALGASAAAAGA
jgi:two-component system LytT family response regulator